MATEVIAEIHVPLSSQLGGEPGYEWIETIELFLGEQEEAGRVEIFDDGEEIETEYVFFLHGAPKDVMLQVASEAVKQPGVPGGSYLTFSVDEEVLEPRIPLPHS